MDTEIGIKDALIDRREDLQDLTGEYSFYPVEVERRGKCRCCTAPLWGDFRYIEGHGFLVTWYCANYDCAFKRVV